MRLSCIMICVKCERGFAFRLEWFMWFLAQRIVLVFSRSSDMGSWYFGVRPRCDRNVPVRRANPVHQVILGGSNAP